ncbi:MAG: ferritin family protein [Methanomassiliicoccales archaeon]|nr:MAG: ferritin family protein [Methanomassiliicoccales archaeon]
MEEESIEILQKAIEIEAFGLEYYNKLKGAVDDREGSALLGYLANAENEHKDHLTGILSKYGAEARKTEIDTLMAEILMDEGIQKIFKDLMKKDKLETVDAIEAIKLGMDVEARSIDFYKQNADKTTESDIATLFSDLSNWEKEHLALLKENLRSLKDEGVWYGYTPILEG